MTGSPEAPAGDEAGGLPDGVSSFVARVLDQLALSAWLPAALLTAAGTLLIEFRVMKSASIGKALDAIASDKLRLLILTLPVLILGTLITQAFSFEAIRTLEGYWRRRGPAGRLRTALTKRHVAKKEKLERHRKEAAIHAFAVARTRLLVSGISHSIVDALELQMLGQKEPVLSTEDSKILKAMTWRDRCDAWDLAQVDQYAIQERDYPRFSRVLPTKLGNVMRATEDSLHHAGQDVEGFALRRRSTVPARVRVQHDQFRTRLDMYCTLVFVSAVLTTLTLGLLIGQLGWPPIAGLSVGFALLGFASYGAAIASARGYGTALKEMDREPQAATSAATPPAPGS